MNRLIHVGFGNIVNTDKIIAIVSPESAPIKRDGTGNRCHTGTQDEIRPGHGEQSDRAVCTFTRDDCGKSTGVVAGR